MGYRKIAEPGYDITSTLVTEMVKVFTHVKFAQWTDNNIA